MFVSNICINDTQFVESLNDNIRPTTQLSQITASS